MLCIRKTWADNYASRHLWVSFYSTLFESCFALSVHLLHPESWLRQRLVVDFVVIVLMLLPRARCLVRTQTLARVAEVRLRRRTTEND
jgi:hypothetical protein